MHAAYISRLLEHYTAVDSQLVRPSATSPKSTGPANLDHGSELSQRFWHQEDSPHPPPPVPGLCAYCTALSNTGPAEGKSCQQLSIPSCTDRHCSPITWCQPQLGCSRRWGSHPTGTILSFTGDCEPEEEDGSRSAPRCSSTPTDHSGTHTLSIQ